jgi:light-regulated signal transduction histidine kinase (bacteriophytochrome)
MAKQADDSTGREQLGAADVRDDWYGSFNEMSKLNNELLLVQRELSLSHTRLQRTLRELTESREELLAQRDEIQRMNAELARSNEALQQFAYIVSHDLQAPLRAVSGFIQLFSDRYKGQLDERADRWIGFITAGAEQMRRLIADTLAFARAGAPLTRSPVDLNEIVERQRQQFADQLNATGGELICEPLPTVSADATQLEQVLQNLIQNALAYRSEQPPRIRISALRSDDAWLISVADNGIGIAPEHHHMVFEPLRRVAQRTDVPGTGLGLAICERIVRRHGGQLWVESELGSGSTFRVSLPDSNG